MEIAKATVQEIMTAPEFPALIDAYAAESAVEGLPSPMAKLEGYRALEFTGVIHVFSAVENGALAGFITVAAPPSLHFSVPLAVTESFYVTPAHRGLTGLRLLATAERQAKDCGSPGLLVTAPLGGKLCRLLECPKLGYRPVGMTFFKALTDVH